MELRRVAETSKAVAETSSRLKKVELLASLLSSATPDTIEPLVAFLSGGPRQGRIGIGGSAIRAAVPDRAAAQPSLTVEEVDTALGEIARARGARSNQERVRQLRALLERAIPDEQQFLTRLLYGELRQGALEGVLVEAVARAARLGPDQVRRAAMLAGDLGRVARSALVEGAAGLSRYAIQLFQPVQPMLAESAASVEAAMTSAGDAAVELKVDGARIQVHKDGDEVRVYTRNLRDVTPSVPEVVSVTRAMPARSLILDGEAIALRPNGAPHPFQVTMRRFGRRKDDEALRRDLPLTPLFFDCLFADDAPALDEPLERRLDLLHAVASTTHTVPHLHRPSRADAEAFLRKALAEGHEGIMIKALGAGYAAGRRGQSWLKVKQAQTLDLVVLAAEWGSGRRRGWLSNLHLGARDPEHHGFVMLGKTFKGLTDEMLAWQTQRFLQLEIGRDEHTVFLRPEVVVEIAFNDLQESPHYPGGLALRFARVKRYRADKTAEEADTINAVREIFARRNA